MAGTPKINAAKREQYSARKRMLKNIPAAFAGKRRKR
jgi:hypothetical protein